MFLGEPVPPAEPEQRPSVSTSGSSTNEEGGTKAAAEGGREGGDSQAITRTIPSIKLPDLSSISLVEPSQKRKRRSAKAFRVLRAMLRSFPILTPTACKLSSLPGAKLVSSDSNKSRTGVGSGTGTKVTGTLFGYKKGKVSLSIQETPKCLPSLVLELGIHTSTLQKEIASGMVRIALECEKKPQQLLAQTGEKPQKTQLLDEPVWTMYCNGKRTGYGEKREAKEEDLSVMELLKAVSQGAGVLPLEAKQEDETGSSSSSDRDPEDCELAYMRAHFEHVVGSRDSETLYMLNPEGNSGPELTIFFVRI